LKGDRALPKPPRSIWGEIEEFLRRYYVVLSTIVSTVSGLVLLLGAVGSLVLALLILALLVGLPVALVFIFYYPRFRALSLRMVLTKELVMSLPPASGRTEHLPCKAGQVLLFQVSSTRKFATTISYASPLGITTIANHPRDYLVSELITAQGTGTIAVTVRNLSEKRPIRVHLKVESTR